MSAATKSGLHRLPRRDAPLTAELLEQILRRELMHIDRPPPLIDEDAERTIVAGVLCGAVHHDDLPLAERHFALPFLGAAYRLSSETAELGSVGMALRGEGYASTTVAEVYTLSDCALRPSRTPRSSIADTVSGREDGA